MVRVGGSPDQPKSVYGPKQMRLLPILLLLTCILGGSFAIAAETRPPLELRIVHFSDLDRMEAQDNKGGLAKLARIVRELRSEIPPVLVTHGGDTISPSVMSSLDQGRHMIDLLNHLPLDVMVLGNHEFDFGLDVLRERLAETQFSVLASNLVTPQGEPLAEVQTGVLLPFDGWTIGIFGLVTPDTLYSSNPGDLDILPELEAAPLEAERLREAGADLVIALAHSDWQTDIELLRQGAADLILGGHDHVLHLLAPANGSALVEAGAQGEHVAIITLRLEEADGGVKWSASYEFRPTDSVEPDVEMARRVSDHAALVQQELSRKLALTEVELDSRRWKLRAEEAPFGNLIADALRAETGADVAIQHAGGLRAEKIYSAGTYLTHLDVVAELPFSNRVELLELDGESLREALEHALGELEQMSGRFPQVSGIEVTYDPARPPGQRLVQVLVQGEELEPARLYRVAVNSFIGRGGDGFEMLTHAKRLSHPAEDVTDSGAVVRYLERQRTVTPRTEGRLRVIR